MFKQAKLANLVEYRYRGCQRQRICDTRGTEG
jgi:hypothetical protein